MVGLQEHLSGPHRVGIGNCYHIPLADAARSQRVGSLQYQLLEGLVAEVTAMLCAKKCRILGFSCKDVQQRAGTGCHQI